MKRSDPSTDSLNLLGRDGRREAGHVHFRARLKRDPTKRKFFDAHEDFAVISPHYIFFGISIWGRDEGRLWQSEALS
jgi:hypothetical protein